MSKHPIKGHITFQGLKVDVETPAGENRHWHDPNSNEKGITRMEYPYGYIKGTLGLDGQEVDVFVGPDKKSDKVYVVTQMRKDLDKDGDRVFEHIDEQKVMLGFSSKRDAKHAYMRHYDDYRFFGKIKKFKMAKFKEKLMDQGKKGKLIKGLYIIDTSANIEKAFESKAQQRYMYAAAGRGEIPKKTVEEFSDKTKDFSKLPDKKAKKSVDKAHMKKGCTHKEGDMEQCSKCDATSMMKALTSRMLVTAKHGRQALENTKVELDNDPILSFTEQSAIITEPTTNRIFESPVAPAERIATPFQTATSAPDFMTDCNTCGYIHKSISSCPKCEQIHAMNREAGPFWKR